MYSYNTFEGKKEKIFKIYFCSNRVMKKIFSSFPSVTQYDISKLNSESYTQIFP